jgi:hypothetical protein
MSATPTLIPQINHEYLLALAQKAHEYAINEGNNAWGHAGSKETKKAMCALSVAALNAAKAFLDGWRLEVVKEMESVKP